MKDVLNTPTPTYSLEVYSRKQGENTFYGFFPKEGISDLDQFYTDDKGNLLVEDDSLVNFDLEFQMGISGKFPGSIKGSTKLEREVSFESFMAIESYIDNNVFFKS